MVKIETLKPKDISHFVNVARLVISENKYYSQYARSEELKDLKKDNIIKNIQKEKVYLVAKEKKQYRRVFDRIFRCRNFLGRLCRNRKGASQKGSLIDAYKLFGKICQERKSAQDLVRYEDKQ